MSISGLKPIPQDPLLLAFEYLDSREVGRIARVSQHWNHALQGRDFWIMLSLREDVPLVEGEGRDVRRDFRILHPMAKGGVRPQDIGLLFGRVVDDVHKMAKALFDKIAGSPEIKSDFVIVDFSGTIEVSVGPARPLILDDQGRLQTAPGSVEEGVIRCPLSLYNMRSLRPALFYMHSWGAAFDQCDNSPATGYFVMRRTVPDNTRNKSWDAQTNLLKSQGYVATPLEVRTLFDLKCGDACPDGRDPWTFVRTPQAATNTSGASWHLVVGGFAPGAGLSVNYYDYDVDGVGVVPCVPAEVL